MKNQKGFSLVEVLVVLGLVGLLCGVAFVNIQKYKGEEAPCISWRDEVITQTNGETKIIKACNEYGW